MIIKASAIEHLDDICAIEQASFGQPWSRASIEAEFLKDYSHAYVYMAEGATVGFIIFADLYDEAEIITVAVKEAYRSRGIGGALLRFALDFLPDKLWFLEVETGNTCAVEMYEKNDFEKVGTIKDYYGVGLDAHRMKKTSTEQKDKVLKR